MGNRVNPPEQLQLPPIEEKGLLFFLKNLKYIVFQLWQRTGAGADFIDELETEVNDGGSVFSEPGRRRKSEK